MTVLSERVRAVKQTKKFLFDLLDPTSTPRVPHVLRRHASNLLRHFPYDMTTERAYLLEAKERKEPLY